MQNAPISRAPVVVVIVFAVVAVTLVFIGMQRPGEAPPEVEIRLPGTAEAPRDVTVIMRDYRFDPTPVVLVPGETVRFTSSTRVLKRTTSSSAMPMCRRSGIRLMPPPRRRT